MYNQSVLRKTSNAEIYKRVEESGIECLCLVWCEPWETFVGPYSTSHQIITGTCTIYIYNYAFYDQLLWNTQLLFIEFIQSLVWNKTNKFIYILST